MTVRHEHWVGGKAVPPAGGAYLPTTDPSTRRPGHEVAAGSATDVDLAVRAAQPGWARLSGAERSEMLRSVAGVLERDADELVALERAGTGKTPAQARLEVDMSAAYFRSYAGILRAVGGRTIDLGAAAHTDTRLEPYGVVGVITPWNFPLNQACRAAAPARAAGLVPAIGGAADDGGPASRGRYVRPTVYVAVDAQAAVAREEVFGPVLVTMPFADEEDAVARANDTDYGLVGTVWSGDVARGLRVAERIDVGQVAVNGGPLTIETPSGGFTQSGYGREKGVEALLDYSHAKTISLSLR